MPLTERAMHALLQLRLGQDLDRQGWREAYEDHGLAFARENGAPLRAAENVPTSGQREERARQTGGPRGDRTHNPRIKSSD